MFLYARLLAQNRQLDDAKNLLQKLTVSYPNSPDVKELEGKIALVQNHALLPRHADLAMTQRHVEALQAAFPECSHRLYTLAEMIDQMYDIRDPFGGPRSGYVVTARELEQLIDEGYERIVALVEQREA